MSAPRDYQSNTEVPETFERAGGIAEASKKSGTYQNLAPGWDTDISWEFDSSTGQLTISGKGRIPPCFVAPADQREEGMTIDVDPKHIREIYIAGKIIMLGFGAFIGCNPKSIDLQLFTDGHIACSAHGVFSSTGATPCDSSTHPVKNLYIGPKTDVAFGGLLEGDTPENVYYYGTSKLRRLGWFGNPKIHVTQDYPWDNFQVSDGYNSDSKVIKDLPPESARSRVPLSDLAAQPSSRTPAPSSSSSSHIPPVAQQPTTPPHAPQPEGMDRS